MEKPRRFLDPEEVIPEALLKPYRPLPDALFLGFRQLGMTSNDLVFVLAVVRCKLSGVPPYLRHVPLHTDQAASAKKRLVANGLMVDATKYPIGGSGPTRHLRTVPAFDLSPLWGKLERLEADQEAPSDAERAGKMAKVRAAKSATAQDKALRRRYWEALQRRAKEFPAVSDRTRKLVAGLRKRMGVEDSAKAAELYALLEKEFGGLV